MKKSEINFNDVKMGELVDIDAKVKELLENPSSHGCEVQIPQALKVYPNPAPTGSVMRIEGDKSIFGTLDVYNLRGQRVASAKMIRGQALLSLEEYPTGLYFYKLRSNEGIISGKYIITR